jgi:hypothetical protein
VKGSVINHVRLSQFDFLCDHCFTFTSAVQ